MAYGDAQLPNICPFREYHMRDLSLPPQTSVIEAARMPVRWPAVVVGFLLTMMPLLTGCGGGDTSGQPNVVVIPSNDAAASARLTWNPVPDESVLEYVIHYGRQSPNQSGSCAYESSISVDSPPATITNLDPNTLYYFTVSAYNGLESVCSNEVSIVTSLPASV